MAVWVRLNSVQYLEKNGRNVKHYPGDWVKVSKTQAQYWLTTGQAEIPDARLEKILTVEDAGVVITAPDHFKAGRARLASYSGSLQIEAGDPNLIRKYTLIWNPELYLRLEFVPVGFTLLKTWEIACPIYNYEELAIHIGSSEDRDYTKSIVRDLRVPLYDPRLIFVRRNETTLNFIRTFLEERKKGDERLAFLRCLYEIKPLVLALPTVWNDKDEE